VEGLVVQFGRTAFLWRLRCRVGRGAKGVAVLGASLVFFWVGPALAEGRQGLPAVLEYTRAPGTRLACPDARFLRQVVAVHFGGHDPFVPVADRRLSVIMRHDAKGYGVQIVLYDRDRRLGSSGDQIHEPDCVRAAERTALDLVTLLMPLTPVVAVAPARTPPNKDPAVEPPLPPPPQSKPAPPRAEEPTPPKPAPPTQHPKPRVFDGGAGFVRALAFGMAAGGTLAGGSLAVLATKRHDAAQGRLGMLQQQAGASPCLHSPPSFASDCVQIGALQQASDNYRNGSTAVLAAAGLIGAAATASSIWFMKTSAPAMHSVQVTPSAAASFVGVTVQGLW
jgi:hypothetical protein